MPRYLISFDDGSMNHIPKEDWPAVGEASHEVVRQAKAAGVWIFGGGVERQQATLVATDGSATRARRLSSPPRRAPPRPIWAESM